MYLRQFVPAFVSRTSPVGGTLGCIHSGSGALGLRAILGADIHQLGILKIQITFAAPVFTSTANCLFPLKLRNWCFLNHCRPLLFYDFNDPNIRPVGISRKQKLFHRTARNIRQINNRISRRPGSLIQVFTLILYDSLCHNSIEFFIHISSKRPAGSFTHCN